MHPRNDFSPLRSDGQQPPFSNSAPEQDRHHVISGSGFIHRTPAEALTHEVERAVKIGDRTFHITYPGNADQLLDHPSTHQAFAADEYMPYWAELWPASQMLAQALIAQAPWPQGTSALEIGCGVGLAGVVALSLGIDVIFSDYDRAALEFAARNARANGFSRFTTEPLDWRHPPDWQVPLILASDVIYEERHIPPLINLLQQVLAPGGQCLLSDPDRSTRGGFRYALKQAKLTYTAHTHTVAGPEGRDVRGTVYQISR